VHIGEKFMRLAKLNDKIIGRKLEMAELQNEMSHLKSEMHGL
jgi:hypothetical protein